MEEPDGLAEWAVANVPDAMRDDPIWRLPAYRYALYVGDLVQDDLPQIRAHHTSRALADQLLKAVESISANIAEGYSRTTGPDRAKFFEYAHSSARESRDWLFKVRRALDPTIVTARIALVTRIMRILVVAIKDERRTRQTRARRFGPDLDQAEA